MLDDNMRRRQAAKWLIGVITICILIYLCIRHIEIVTGAISWVVGLFLPLIIGIILALILNVPMCSIERRFLSRLKIKRGKRSLAIVMALICVISVIVGIMYLVVPELIRAAKLLVQIAIDGVEYLMQMNDKAALMQEPWKTVSIYVDRIWEDVKFQMEQWLQTQSGTFVNQAVDIVGSMISMIAECFIGLIFAIYILARKEILKGQTVRLIRAWLPQKTGEGVIHAITVCSDTFRLFIGGQAIEAVILGTLCMIGMTILQLPYAPMIGALVGACALIPVVGAIVGGAVGVILILTVNPWKALVFLIFLLILQQVEGHVIYPQVVGSKVNLPAIWVLTAVIVGGKLGGAVGMFLGVPAMAAIYILVREATEVREKVPRNNP